MSMKKSMDERRRSSRLPWLRFESKVLVRRSLLKREWIPVVPFDFSRYGVGVQTDENYEIGDEVVLSINLAKEGGLELAVPRLKGLVRYKEKHHSRFNYGVEFVFESKSEKLQMEEDLISIERILKNFEAGRQDAESSVRSA